MKRKNTEIPFPELTNEQCEHGALIAANRFGIRDIDRPVAAMALALVKAEADLKHLQDLGKALCHQIAICDYVDELGHQASRNKCYIDLRDYLRIDALDHLVEKISAHTKCDEPGCLGKGCLKCRGV
jgi:hypothetical protein